MARFLHRVKAEAGEVAFGADLLPVVAGAAGVGAVFDDGDLFADDLAQPAHVHGRPA
jgi:hypothetical protein